MTNRDEVLTKEARHGRAALAPEEREIYFVYRTICELENGGLSGLLYNISPDWDYLKDLSSLLRQKGEPKLADLFTEAEAIHRSGPAEFRGSWSGWLELADPEKKLEQISDELGSEQSRLWDLLGNEE